MMMMVMMMMMMMNMMMRMMRMKMTSRCVLSGQGVQPNFRGVECATDDCTGKQPDDDDHHFNDDDSHLNSDDDHFDGDYCLVLISTFIECFHRLRAW